MEAYDVRVEWRPYFLHPEIPPGGARLDRATRLAFAPTRRRLRERAAEDGLTMVEPEIVAYTRTALEATEYAREQGRHHDFHRRVFERYYGRGEDIGRWEVLRETAQEVELDPDEMQRAVEAGGYRAVVDRHVTEARALGIAGVPTFIFDGRYGIVGAQPFESLERVMKRLADE